MLHASPVKIVIDIREASRPRVTGKGQWTRGFLRELATRGGIELVGVCDTASDLGIPTSVIPGSGLAWHYRVARWLAREKPGDLYVSPTSYLVPALLGSRFPCLPIVHDLIAFRREPHDKRAQLIERLTLGRAARTAAHVCTVSDSSREDLLKRYSSLSPSRVSAIFAGPSAAAPEPNRPDHYTILCIGTLCPRKNQQRLLEAYARLPEGLRASHRLLLAGGRGWGDDSIVALAASTPGAQWRGYVDENEYAELLSTCDVFAYPSLYEGFGLPVLDALQRGVCVLTSDRGSLSEVAADGALVVDPESVESIAKGLTRLLTDDGFRSMLRERSLRQAERFSWERTVDLFLGVVQKM